MEGSPTSGILIRVKLTLVAPTVTVIGGLKSGIFLLTTAKDIDLGLTQAGSIPLAIRHKALALNEPHAVLILKDFEHESTLPWIYKMSTTLRTILGDFPNGRVQTCHPNAFACGKSHRRLLKQLGILKVGPTEIVAPEERFVGSIIPFDVAANHQ